MALQVKKKYPVPRKSKSHETLPQRTLRRENRKRSMQRVTTSVLVMLSIAIIGGVVYTWYAGQQKPKQTAQASTIGMPKAFFKPPKISSKAKIGVAIQTTSSSVKPGENASITVRTNPEATCTIGIKYGEVPATDSGVTAPKIADEFGMASWAWTVPASAPAGKWPVDITCKNKTNSGVVSTDLIVAQ